MRPNKIKKTIEVWDCGIEQHNHMKEKYAKNCIDSNATYWKDLPNNRTRRKEKMVETVRLKDDVGLKFKEIAVLLGIAVVTARQYYKDEKFPWVYTG